MENKCACILRGIGKGIFGLFIIAAIFSCGCIDEIDRYIEPTYTVQVDCPLSSRTFTGLTLEEVRDVEDRTAFYCAISIRQEG